VASADVVADVAWSDTLQVATRLGVAALGGLAVGIEREWSARARARPARFAGVRTFLPVGLLVGLGTTLSDLAGPAIGLVVVAGPRPWWSVPTPSRHTYETRLTRRARWPSAPIARLGCDTISRAHT
jgi:hypothetical protein